MLATLLQVLCLVCMLVALVALFGWQWSLLSGSIGGFVAAVQLERRKAR